MPAFEESPAVCCTDLVGRYAFAVERYVLHEMPREESEAFEIHFLSCPACADGVLLLMALFDNGRAVFAMESNGDNPPA